MFKRLLIILLSICIYFNSALADKLNEIIVKGNERISNETIILFSGIKLNDDIDTNILNDMIKKLWDIIFENISINFNNNILYINVIENHLIQTVEFTGIKNKSLIENLKKTILQKEKSSFVDSKIQEDQNRVINSLRSIGYYFSSVDTKIKKNDNNTVDLIYNVNLGRRHKLKKLNL